MFEFNNEEYTLEQIEAAAQQSNIAVEDYIKKYNIKELGKETTTSQSAGVEETAALETPGTVSNLEDISLDSPKAESKTAGQTLDLEPEKEDDGRLGILSSLATSFNLIPANIQKQEIGVRDLILLIADKQINPELSRQERFDKLNKYFNNDDDPIAGYPGLGIIRTADTKEEAVNVIKDLRDKQMKTEQQSLSKAFEQGNIKDAAFLAADGLIQTLPSLGFSMLGGGGIAAHGILIAGEKFNDEYLNNPQASDSAIIANALATGAIQAGADYLFRGLLKTSGVIAKEGTATQAKEFLNNSFGKLASKYLAVPLEGTVEVSQDLLTKGVDDLFLGRDWRKHINKYELIDSFVLGSMMQGGVSVASYMTGANQEQRAYAEGLLMPETLKPQLNFYTDQYSKIANQIKEEGSQEAKNALEKQLQEIESKITTLSRKYKTALYAMSDSELSEYAANKDAIEKLKNDVSNSTTSEGKRAIYSEIDALNKSNEAILKEAVTRKYTETTQKSQSIAEDMGIGFKVFTNAQEFSDYVNSKAEGNKIYNRDDGTILQYKDGTQEIVINEEVALEQDAVNVASHELLHAVLFNTLRQGGKGATKLADALAEELAKIDPNKVLDSNLASRLRNYSEFSEEIQNEEVLTLFSDAIATGDIKFNESIFTSIGDFARQTLQNSNIPGFKNIKFNSGRNVFNFIKDFNKSVDKGIITGAIKRGAKEGFEGKLTEQEADEIISREMPSRSEASEKVQQIYEEQGAAGAMDIIDQFAPIVDKLVKKYRNVPGFEYQLLRDEIETGKRGILDMIMEYTPEKANGAPLAGYINKFLSRRAIEAASRVLDTEFTEDVTEAKKVTSTETAEQTIEAAETAPKQPETSTLAQKLELTDDVKTKVLDAVTKTFGTKLPDTTADNFRDALIKAYRTELKPVIAKLMGTRANYESFLADNFEAIYDALPQSTINRRFNEFAEPVLDKDGKQLREKTAVGKGIFKKRKIVKAEWLNYFTGRDVAPSKKGTRKTSIAEEIGVEVAFDATLAALSNPDVLNKYNDIRSLQGFDPVNNTIDVIGKEIDRANVKFSNSETIIGVVSTKLPNFIKELKKSNRSEGKIKKILKNLYGDLLTQEDREVFANYLIDEIIGNTTFTNIPDKIFTPENLAKYRGKKGVTYGVLHLDQKFKSIKILADQHPELPQWALRDVATSLNSYIKNSGKKPQQLKTGAIIYTLMRDTLAKEASNPLFPLNGVGEYDNWFKNTFGEEIFNYAKENAPEINIHYKIKIASIKAADGDKAARKIIKEQNQLAFEAQKLIKHLFKNSKASTESEWMMLARMLAEAEKGLFRMAAPVAKVIVENKSDVDKGTKIDKLYTYEHRSPQVDPRNAFFAYYALGEKSINLDQVFADFQVVIAPNSITKPYIDKVFKYSNPIDHIPGKTNAIEVTYHHPKIAAMGAPMLDIIDVKTGKVTKPPVTVKFSKSLSRQFNELIEGSTGVEWYKTFSPAKARLVGKGKGKGKFFVPYSAEDFVGLLYTTLGEKKVGDQQMAWYEENLIRPFSRGIQAYEAAKQKAMRDWAVLKKEASKNVPGGLSKTNKSGFTNETAVRAYIWQRQGMEVPGLSKKDLNENLKAVNANPELKAFAEKLMVLNPEGYPKPSKEWDSGTITTDLISYVDDVRRGEFLTEWKENADQIFTEDNINKLRALYGEPYVDALNDMLHAMRTGRSRKMGVSKIEKAFVEWTSNSVGAIMFFNTRSAILQTLSSVNFINFSDNNPINAGLAFANQKQYWKDFATLFNSDFLKQRRSGLQSDVNSDDIAKAAATSSNKARAVISTILKFGFTPTQIADSFAIASGGATMYRNRIKKYLKEGLDQETAEKRAFTDFQEIAEETQQSARPDRISMQQRSSLGRFILAFGNTPMQYARLTKKAAQDLVNGRGDWKTNISKIAYYSVIQNIIFSALQSGLFALLFSDEEDDKEKERYFKAANSSIDSLLRGTGVYGAAAATVKNMILKIIEENKKSNPDYEKVAIEATAISPPINSKLKKLLAAGRTFKYKQSKEKIYTEGLSLENPAFLAAGQIISAGTNLPADRLLLKTDHIYTAMKDETELWQSIALAGGWSEWDLGMIEKQTKKAKKPTTTFKTNKFNSGFKRKKFKTN